MLCFKQESFKVIHDLFFCFVLFLKLEKFEVSVAVKHNESVIPIALRYTQNLLRNFKRRLKKTHPINQNAPSLCILSSVLRTFLKKSYFCGE